MSIKLITLVWDKFDASGSELLCLLALADFANDQGGSIHPSIKTLATKIRASESQARRVLHKLIDDGFVSVVGNHDGGAPGMTRRYAVNVAKLKALPDVGETGSVDATPSMGATGGTGARDGSHGCAETGGMGATQTVNEPSDNRQLKTKAKADGFDPIAALKAEGVPEQQITDFLKIRKAKRAPLTQTALDGIRREANTASLSMMTAITICCENGWQGFKASWLNNNRFAGGSKPGAGTHTNFKDKDYGTGTPISEIPWLATPEA